MASMASQSLIFGTAFLQRYEVREKIGKGFYASVHRCVRRSDSMVLAVKAIDVRPLRLRENFSRDRLMREVHILQRLSHPSIIRLTEAVWNQAEGGDHLLLVMEYAPGQELFDAIITNGKFTESDAREIIAQLVSALRYCHDRDIVHRDVKPENILLVSSDLLRRTGSSGQSDANESAKKANNSKFVVKLLDFGLSRTVGSSGAQTFAGTPEYFAPEVDPRTRSGGSRGAYGVAADCWSLGAVIFVMLSGVFPEFTGEGASRQISFGRESYWGHISGHAKDLIAQLMHPDPNQRITMTQAARHPWLVGLVYESKHQQNGSGAKTTSSSTTSTNSSSKDQEDTDVDMGGTTNDEDNNGVMSPRSHVTSQMEKCSLKQSETNETGNNNSSVGKLRANSVGDKRGRDSPTAHSHTPTNGAGPDTQDEEDDSDSTPADLANVRLGADAIAFLETDHLYLLQNQLAVLFHEAYVTYVNQNDPSMMSTIRMHAIECRQLFKSSAALMNKLGGTAANVMNLLPDLKAGVEENEPEFAEVLFAKIKGWISELKEESKKMMDDNSRVIRQLNISMENAKQGLLESVASHLSSSPLQTNGDGGIGSSSGSGGNGNGNGRSGGKAQVSRSLLMGVVETASPMVEVMRPRGHSLFGKDGALQTGLSSGTGMTADIDAMNLGRKATLDTSGIADMTKKQFDDEDGAPEFEELRSATSSPVHRAHKTSPPSIDTTLDGGSTSKHHHSKACTETSLICTPPRSPSGGCQGGRKHPNDQSQSDALVFRQRVQHLQRALAKLTQVDRILGGLSMFWDHMETAVTLLSQKNDHVESLLAVTKNPKLKRRFFTRLSEYSHMWKAVALASKRYQSSETGKNGQHSAIAQQYQAIENGDARNENGTSSVGHMRQPSFDQGGMEIEEMPSL